MAISQILAGVSGAADAPTPSGPTTEAASGFGTSLERMLEAVEAKGVEANDAVGRMLAGHGDVHSALIALQNADSTFQLTVQVRNKLVQAYQDVMRMPI
jgi:flagellar hook-basal body complex protein FliE